MLLRGICKQWISDSKIKGTCQAFSVWASPCSHSLQRLQSPLWGSWLSYRRLPESTWMFLGACLRALRCSWAGALSCAIKWSFSLRMITENILQISSNLHNMFSSRLKEFVCVPHIFILLDYAAIPELLCVLAVSVLLNIWWWRINNSPKSSMWRSLSFKCAGLWSAVKNGGVPGY